MYKFLISVDSGTNIEKYTYLTNYNAYTSD